MASQILGAKKSQSRLGASIVGKARQEEDPILAQQRKAREQREAEETQPLVDEEDDEIQRILAAEVQPMIEIDQFIAHSDVAPPAQDNIPSQVEAIYRDVNSMIDTCGLNARSAMAFVLGNMRKLKPGRRTKDDLEDMESWVLCEVDELSDIVFEELAPALEDSRVQDVDAKKTVIGDLARNMSRLRAKQQDMEIILRRFDPDRVQEHRNLPLSAEQAAQQNELRRALAKFTKQLSELEEGLTLLKTKLAATHGASGKNGATQPPTVEAVLKTISKMTSMVEKRSGDVDVLENQMRKLRMSTVSREGSPMTPKRGGSVARHFTPEPSTPGARFRSPFAGSVSSHKGTPTRKKMSGFSVEEKKELMEKRKRRLEVVGRLKDRVVQEGVKVWTLDDPE
jgi:nucleoporin NUP159